MIVGCAGCDGFKRRSKVIEIAGQHSRKRTSIFDFPFLIFSFHCSFIIGRHSGRSVMSIERIWRLERTPAGCYANRLYDRPL